MEIENSYAIAVVSDKGKKSLQGGHPWVYEDEVLQINGNYTDGDLVTIRSLKDKFLGTGFINSHSKIRIRCISRNANDVFNEAFYTRRIRHALDYRKTVMGDDYTNCRLIFGEADFFPGLTIDRFNDLLVSQTLSLGIEKIKPMLFSILRKELEKDGQVIHGIYERNDVAIRQLEGLEENKGWYVSQEYPDVPSSTTTDICENGITYHVDVENGQKTGFFLDQKFNRFAISKLCKDKTVLDCFTHTGSFGLNAAKGGANKVVSLDISQSAIDMAIEHSKINHLDHIVSYECCDVFHYLDELIKTKSKEFDFIILDPPAFTKSRQTIENATNGYKQINTKAMRILPRGGYLATCSCSHFMNEGLFKRMLHESAEDANVQLRQIAVYQQGSDHPILWNVNETNYLKFFIFQIV